MKLDHCYIGDCRGVMRSLIADGVRVQTVVTSPPYYALRDYGVPGQLGLEASPLRYLARMRSVFRQVRELLADDGTLWLNMGDSYCTRPNGGIGHNSQLNGGKTPHSEYRRANSLRSKQRQVGIKHKDLLGMPWLLALTLRADGWYLRRDIIWSKPNPMPESITDRPATAHEYIFLLSKSARYYYDAEAIKEPVSGTAHARGSGVNPKSRVPHGWDTGPGDHRSRVGRYAGNGVGFGHGYDEGARQRGRVRQNESFSGAINELVDSRNKRSVWTVPTQPFSGAHFATFPEKLIEPCILAGSRPGDIVFDPFMGAGTVGAVAARLGRRWLGAEINASYVDMQKPRTAQQGMPL